MVCLTSCVFRSIRFSGFARPHFGVRREGEVYTRPQAEGKGEGMSPRDAHKSGDNRSLGAFPGLGGWPARSLRTARSLEAARARSAAPRPSPIMA